MARPADPRDTEQAPGRLTVPAETAFVVTVGVPLEPRRQHAECQRVQVVLRQAGFQCGPASGDTILALAEQERATRELAANDPEDQTA